MTKRTPFQELSRYPGFRAMTLFCLAFLYAPLLIVSLYSFNSARSITSWGGFSFKWYVTAWQNPVLASAALNSVMIALVAATLATTIATFAAIGIDRGSENLPFKSTITGLISFPLLVPEIVTAISSLIFFVAIGVPLGYIAIVLAHTVFCIPFAYLPIRARLSGVDTAYEDAAADLYASRAATIRSVLLPLMIPGMVSGFCLAFIVSLDDFIIANFLTGPGTSTLPVTLYGLARVGFSPEINAVATVMLLVSTLFVGASWLIGRKQTS